MPTKVPRKRRRELRSKVSAVIASKLGLMDLEGFVDPITADELEYAKGFLEATRMSFETRAMMPLPEGDDQ